MLNTKPDLVDDWQRRLDADGSVTLRASTRRNAVMLAISVVILAFAIYSLVTTGPSLWAIGGIVLFGGGGLVAARHLLLGAPSITITRTGLSLRGGDEVPYARVRELMTSRQGFGVWWEPLPGEQLRSASERQRGLKYGLIPAEGVGDPNLLAGWVMVLIDPTAQPRLEKKLGGLMLIWLLPES